MNVKEDSLKAVDGKGNDLGHLLAKGLYMKDFEKFFEELRDKIYDQCMECIINMHSINVFIGYAG